MPTYDYVCNNCEHAFELFQPMSARVKRKCPACGEKTLERLIGTGAAVIFKGSGFYETDYRSDSYKKAAEAEGKSEKANSESKTAGNADSAPPEKKNTENNRKPEQKSAGTAPKSDTKTPAVTSAGNSASAKNNKS